MSQYQAAPPPSAASYPGKTLGIVGLILAIIPCTWWAGLIVSIIAFVQSRNAGVKNTPAFVGIIVAAVYLVLAVVGYATGLTAQYMPR
ncbi:hypothetical protein [Microlunatus flavus]|uniref:DUF4190 domain-containing protein n=1 Tax=Microlunatus flavus TaxID=1036181 RepID=A0A1H9AJJ7_9ACTN|nr:hypothetical protein [Microlunatus flavus]SEP76138.1 hypothetical protein SAMN05421756_101611 [Microlunatus flavus]